MRALRYLAWCGSALLGVSAEAKADKFLDPHCAVLIALQAEPLPTRVAQQLRLSLAVVPRVIYEFNVDTVLGSTHLDRPLNSDEVNALILYFQGPVGPEPLSSALAGWNADLIDGLYSSNFFNTFAHQQAIISVLVAQNHLNGPTLALSAIEGALKVGSLSLRDNPMQIFELLAMIPDESLTMSFVLNRFETDHLLEQLVRDEPDDWQPFLAQQQIQAVGHYLENIFSEVSPQALSGAQQERLHNFLRRHIYWSMDALTSGQTGFFLEGTTAVNLVNHGRLHFAYSLSSVGHRYWKAAGRSNVNNPYYDLMKLLEVNLQTIDESQKLAQLPGEDDYSATWHDRERTSFLRKIPGMLRDTQDDFSLDFDVEFQTLPGTWQPVPGH